MGEISPPEASALTISLDQKTTANAVISHGMAAIHQRPQPQHRHRILVTRRCAHVMVFQLQYRAARFLCHSNHNVTLFKSTTKVRMPQSL